MSKIASAIKAAEAALNKGEYSVCIKIVDPLLLDFQAETAIGGQLRLLIITAYMGKGDEQKAINICCSFNTVMDFSKFTIAISSRDIFIGDTANWKWDRSIDQARKF